MTLRINDYSSALSLSYILGASHEDHQVCDHIRCIRELRSAVWTRRPLLALLESDARHGSISQVEACAQLAELDSRYAELGFEGDGGPTGIQLANALFAAQPIEWTRHAGQLDDLQK